jgi:hypothetical protein
MVGDAVGVAEPGLAEAGAALLGLGELVYSSCGSASSLET